MKRLLLGSIALTTFSVAIIIFQISCQKALTAQTAVYTLPPATSSTLGGIIVGNGLNITSTGILSAVSTSGTLTQLNKLVYTKGSNQVFNIWTANYDGTNQTKVNITLPNGVILFDGGSPRLSPNGQKIFFIAGPSSTGNAIPDYAEIYSCNYDGSNVIKVVAGGTGTGIDLHGAY